MYPVCPRFMTSCCPNTKARRTCSTSQSHSLAHDALMRFNEIKKSQYKDIRPVPRDHRGVPWRTQRKGISCEAYHTWTSQYPYTPPHDYIYNTCKRKQRSYPQPARIGYSQTCPPGHAHLNPTKAHFLKWLRETLGQRSHQVLRALVQRRRSNRPLHHGRIQLMGRWRSEAYIITQETTKSTAKDVSKAFHAFVMFG